MKLATPAGSVPNPSVCGRGHDREDNARTQDGPDQNARDREHRLFDFLAQRRDLLEAREGEQTERQPHGDGGGAHAFRRDEQIAQRRVASRSMPLEHQQQHRAGQQQHRRDGDAFKHDEHKPGAARWNDAQRRHHHGGQQRQDEALRAVPETGALQKIGAEQAERAETDDGKAEVGPEQGPPGHQSGARTQDRSDESIRRAGVRMIAREPRKAPRDQQHDEGGQREDERHHAADMFGRLLRIQVHRQGGRHSGDGDRDGIPGADALEQDRMRVDRRAIRHAVKLARAESRVEPARRTLRRPSGPSRRSARDERYCSNSRDTSRRASTAATRRR